MGKSTNFSLDSLHPQVAGVLRERFAIAELTPVQREAIPLLESGRCDVVAQSPTGSGKTLAYLVPAIGMLLNNRLPQWGKLEIVCLVVVPTNELARQVHSVAGALLDPLRQAGLTAASVRCVHGGGGKRRTAVHDWADIRDRGANMLIGTPGRLAHVIDVSREDAAASQTGCDLSSALRRHCELLVLDEADRLGGRDNVVGGDGANTWCMAPVLQCMDKQRRRTALFSATQPQDLADFVRLGMRNVRRVHVTSARGGGNVASPDGGGDKSPAAESDEQEDEHGADSTMGERPDIPDGLRCYYAVIPAGLQTLALCQFVDSLCDGDKAIVFVSTCACVDYFHRLLKIACGPRVPIYALHGKKKTRGDSAVSRFAAAPSAAVLLATDAAGRGLDLPNVNWVLQAAIPRQASWFVHRAGRTARMGRSGRSVLLLQPAETAYAGYVTAHLALAALHELQAGDTDSAWLSVSEGDAESLRCRVLEKVVKDRELLLRGTKAFVSHVQAYCKHDARLVCPVADWDAVGAAHAFCLGRLPKMPELRGRDLSAFRRLQCSTADVPFVDEKRERERLELRQQRRMEAAKKRQAREARAKSAGAHKRQRDKRVPPAPSDDDDCDDFANDYRLMRKLKANKISKARFDAEFGCADGDRPKRKKRKVGKA